MLFLLLSYIIIRTFTFCYNNFVWFLRTYEVNTILLEKSKASDVARCKWDHVAHGISQNCCFFFKSFFQCVIKQMISL